MSEICTQLHQLVNQVPHHFFPYDEDIIPANGIYVVFEKGELAHGNNRIVRIGTHDGQDRLIKRLKEHFIKDNKDRSIFRKNIGRALLSKSHDPFLAQWEIDLTTREAKQMYAHMIDRVKLKQTEALVSEYIQSKFSFCIIPIVDHQERKYFEAKLISTVSNCHLCRPSAKWLGLHSPVAKIRESGLWNVTQLWKESLSWLELEKIKQKLI